MNECKHQTGNVIQAGSNWKLWKCTWGCGKLTIETDDGKEQTLTELVAERDKLYAALAAIVTAKRNHEDLSGALIQAARLVDEFDEVSP